MFKAIRNRLLKVGPGVINPRVAKKEKDRSVQNRIKPHLQCKNYENTNLFIVNITVHT